MKSNIFAIAAVALFASACANSSNSQQAQPAESPATSISGMSFIITQLNGSALQSCSDDEPATITFEADQVNAYVGCNRIFATPTYGDNGHIALEMGGATRMACPDGCREDEFIDAFNKLDSYVLTDDGVELKDCSGETVIRAKK